MEKKDSTGSIIIYGDSFFFSIHEPMDWDSDIDNAKNYNANIILYKSPEGTGKKDSLRSGTLIQILTYKKTDEEINKDLEQDISVNKEKNHDLKQSEWTPSEQNVEVSHKEYACFTKLIYVDNLFYQYMAYINPGNKFRNAFSVSMNIPKRPATKEELLAFREIISTLVVFKR